MSTKRPVSDMLLTILIVILFGIACISGYTIFKGSTIETTYKVSVILTDSTDTKWDSFISGLEEATAVNNINLNIVTSGNVDTLEREKEVIEEEIANGAKGIIFEPCTSEGLEEILETYSKNVKIAVVGSGFEQITSYENVMFLDIKDAKVGESFCKEVMNEILEEEEIGAKHVGIVIGNSNLDSMKVRLESFSNTANENGLNIVWTIDTTSSIQDAQNISKANVFVALDDDALVIAQKYASSHSKENIQVFGYGCSEENLYHLNTEEIRLMMVPNGYSAAFALLEKMADSFEENAKFSGGLELETDIITQENMFHEIYQQMLFPTTD